MSVRVMKAVEPEKCNVPGKKLWTLMMTGKVPIIQMMKLDGVFCQLVWDEQAMAYEAFTRTGESMPSISPQILMWAREEAARNGCIGATITGEAWVMGRSHSYINGMARRGKVQPELQFWAFDLLEAGYPHQSMHRRLTTLQRFQIGDGFHVVPWTHGWASAGLSQQDNERSYQLAAKSLQDDKFSAYDGLILHYANQVFEEGDGKNGGRYKVKPRPEIDARVVGIEGGKGKYKGMIGKIMIDLGDDKVCGVGSGLSDADRAQPPEYWLNKIAQVSYLSISSKGLLREPAFIRVRDDKTVAQTLY